MVRKTRAHRTSSNHTLTGGANPKNAYNAKNFVRAVLIALEAKTPGLCEGIPSKRLADWCPDQSGHCADVTGDVRKLFGVSPLMLSCWCCMLGSFASAGQRLAALDANDDALWAPLLQHETEEEEEEEEQQQQQHQQQQQLQQQQ